MWGRSLVGVRDAFRWLSSTATGRALTATVLVGGQELKQRPGRLGPDPNLVVPTQPSSTAMHVKHPFCSAVSRLCSV